MKRSNRVWLGAIALGAIVLLTLIAAPGNSHLDRGSTYSRLPDGYGAWYAFMQQQGMPLQRWQKPLNDISDREHPTTLLRISSQLRQPRLDEAEREWVQKGNTLIILGVQEPVSEAAFSTMQSSSGGDVKIDTRLRQQEARQISLGDRFGAVVWVEQVERGKVIFSTTPDIAANAYQDYPGNYPYLAQLVSQGSNSIWVDEYIHGYKDRLKVSEVERDWVGYLAHTPLFPALLQGGILLLLIIWAENRRFGVLQGLDIPVIDNSAAYIQALAVVLQKAEKSEFVLDVVGKEQQLELQKALGLGHPVSRGMLINAWVQQTGASAAELEEVLRLQSQPRRVSDRQLLSWLEKWRVVLQTVSGKTDILLKPAPTRYKGEL